MKTKIKINNIYKNTIKNFSNLKSYFIDNGYVLCSVLVLSVNEPEKYNISFGYKCYIVIMVGTCVSYLVFGGAYAAYLEHYYPLKPPDPWYIGAKIRTHSLPPSKKTGEIPREPVFPRSVRRYWRRQWEQDRRQKIIQEAAQEARPDVIVEHTPQSGPRIIPNLSEFPIIGGTAAVSNRLRPTRSGSSSSSSSSSSSTSFSIYESVSEKFENLIITNDVLVFFSLSTRFLLFILLYCVWRWSIYRV